MKIPSAAFTELIKIVGKENLLTDEVSLSVYAYDCSLSRTRPDALIHLRRADVIAPVLKVLYRYHIPFVPRASATNHAGSCAALNGGVILNVAPLNKILQINTQAGFALVEPGVTGGDLQDALAPLGFFYAPDPASERVCSLSGNLAQNASGARCMKYGGTIDHVLEVDFVMPNGTEIHLSRQDGGPDFIGLIAGSEGTLGVIKQLKVKILPVAKHIKTFLVTFPSLADSVQTVSDLAAEGIIPRCVEAMDDITTRAVEEFAHAGYPLDAKALLILELDGTPAEIDEQEKQLEEICLKNHSLKFLPAKTEAERQRLWFGRRAAYAAMARLAPNVMVGDGTVPRSELPRALAKVRRILDEQHIYASLLFHAGDGNFHPQIIFDERNRPDTVRVTRALKEILQACVDCGGTVSGEHGIGVEKRSVMAYQYDKPTLDLFTQIKKALDPENLANPLKLIPVNYDEKARAQAALSPAIKQLADKILMRKNAHAPCLITGENSRLKTKAANIISTQTLNRILEIDKTNYTVTAEAGVALKTLARALKQAGVYSVLPDSKGTLGGAFCSGCLPSFYAQVLGVEALLPDGSYVRYGGKLMKNAASYHLTRLFAGSQGTLGIVTQLTFKIYAKPVPVAPEKPFVRASGNLPWAAIKKQLDPGDLFPVLAGETNV